MAQGKPDITQLEHLVGQGRHADALDGYLKLLAGRPNDPLLRARVDMLKEAVAQASARQSPFSRPETDLRSTYVVTPEEVADSYVLAGRYDDALVLLEKLLHQRPSEKAVLDRVERVRRLKAAAPDGGAESTMPYKGMPTGMNRAPPPPKDKAPAFGAPKSGSLKPAAAPFGNPRSAGGAARPPSSDRLATMVQPPAVEMLRATQPPAAAAPSRPSAPAQRGKAAARAAADPVGAAVSMLAARTDTAPTTPVVTDDPSSGAMVERTLRSPPPRPVRRPLVEATQVAAPSEHLLGRSRTDEVESTGSDEIAPGEPSTNTQMSMAALEERTSPAREMRDPTDEDAAKTLLVRAPTGLHAALESSDEISGGFVSQEIVHAERTQAAPPPVFEPGAKRPAKKR